MFKSTLFDNTAVHICCTRNLCGHIVCCVILKTLYIIESVVILNLSLCKLILCDTACSMHAMMPQSFHNRGHI